ncbi:hypothetical protein C2G38_2215928 [Gigaspora rosea]|uniref:Uncharacterized protein n=1 Tax=Gigaspora rosea TaxID=44941 RepID=A0A397UCV9_9GLOM|nr:hypothetical protein C2G38_2215928 [Gigaspora rosea]
MENKDSGLSSFLEILGFRRFGAVVYRVLFTISFNGVTSFFLVGSSEVFCGVSGTSKLNFVGCTLKLLLRGTKDSFTKDSFWRLCNKQTRLVGTDEILSGYNPIG